MHLYFQLVYAPFKLKHDELLTVTQLLLTQRGRSIFYISYIIFWVFLKFAIRQLFMSKSTIGMKMSICLIKTATPSDNSQSITFMLSTG